MLDGKKERLKFLFVTRLMLSISMSISLFRWTAQLIKTQKFFATKTTELCSIILVNKIIEFYRYTKNKKTKHLSFFLRFSIIGINLLPAEVLKSTLGKTMKKIKKTLNWPFSPLVNFFCTYHYLPPDTKIMDSMIQFALLKVKSKF